MYLQGRIIITCGVWHSGIRGGGIARAMHIGALLLLPSARLGMFLFPFLLVALRIQAGRGMGHIITRGASYVIKKASETTRQYKHMLTRS